MSRHDSLKVCCLWVQAPKAYATSLAPVEVPAAPLSIAARPVHHAEPIQDGVLGSNVQKRRSLRRLRRWQVATAAAVAGAVAGVSLY